jgi:hypothetical protein
MIANAVDLPGHAAIVRVPACEIAPDSDLLDLPVTRGVGDLTRNEVTQALDAGEGVASELQQRGLICAAALSLQGHARVLSPLRPGWTFDDAPRSLVDA